MAESLQLPTGLAGVPACSRCRHGYMDGGELVCRRNPPQVTIVLVPNPSSLSRGHGLTPQILAGFPNVTGDMACGEFSVSARRMD